MMTIDSKTYMRQYDSQYVILVLRAGVYIFGVRSPNYKYQVLVPGTGIDCGTRTSYDILIRRKAKTTFSRSLRRLHA